MTTLEIIATIKRLVALPSTANNHAALREAATVVADIIQKTKGITIEWFEQNGKPSFIAYRGKMRPTHFDILLNGHVDVVPGKPEQFIPTVKNGRLYGRGALDMKGTTTVLADVFCEMANRVPYVLGLQVVTDEEVGGYDGVAYQITQGIWPRLAIMGEYTNDFGVIYNRARGLCWVELAFKGKAAHSGHLWHGSNAVIKASDFARGVLQHYPTPTKETWTTTASVAGLTTGNDAYNRVPDDAVLKIDFRFVPEDKNFTDKAALLRFFKSIDPDVEVLQMPAFEPPVQLDKKDKRLTTLQSAFAEAIQQPVRVLSRPGATDGRHFALTNSDVIEFGLFGRGQHSDHEYVELSSIESYKATLQTFLTNVTPHIIKGVNHEQANTAKEPSKHASSIPDRKRGLPSK
ncbi:MAG TPA: M20 family metallopeptidase [Candidatus Saccharimonadales bacterium]|nr:M20 family metallopeptidase [Candidatus Saccharimonadales bacterium]